MPDAAYTTQYQGEACIINLEVQLQKANLTFPVAVSNMVDGLASSSNCRCCQ